MNQARRRFAAGIISALTLGTISQGCLDRPLDTIEPRSTTTLTVDLGADRIDKIDILLAIDDSGSMGDKQVILSEAIPRLVESLVNPDCIPNDPEQGTTPITPEGDTCPEGMHRIFEPVSDIHVGVISTSVPVANADGDVFKCDGDATLRDAGVDTYAGTGFLAWDPQGKKDPAGEQDSNALRDDLARLVTGVGQTGCALEQPLESWYRFLIDPDTDNADLVAQRNAFLRPDSLVAIVMLTDENDCSIDPSREFEPAGLPGRANLSCFDQADKLYPAQRYVDGLRSPMITNAAGERVENPLFAGNVRGADRVLLAGIVGVPWQRLARDPDNLAAGLMNATELRDNNVWASVLGEPDEGVAPRDAHMIESEEPRPGLPLKDGALDPVHGHEHTVGTNGSGELQYACVFDLPESFHRECTGIGCDCTSPGDKSVCRQDDGTYGNVQRRAKAYPGLRQLHVLREIDQQAIVASICASQLEDERAPDYGYQPAIGALLDRLSEKLAPPCLSRDLKPNAAGQVQCIVLEATAAPTSCSCEGAGRAPVAPEHHPAVQEAMRQKGMQESELDCFCEVQQLTGDALTTCQNDLDPEAADGWCYTDANVGNPELVEMCTAQPRIIRLMGEVQPRPDARHFITCAQER